MNDISVASFIQSQDPLSPTAIEFLLEYKEEDSRVDYKESLDISNEKEWIGLTKDVMAFANTFGGYLMFGVADSTYDLVGLDKKTADFLKQTDKIQQKINRYIDPPITTLRSKDHKKGGRLFVAVFVPESMGRTHVISQDGAHVFLSGKKKTLLHEGTIYVRRSGGNSLATSRDLDEIIHRRIGQFKTTLLANIARVVEAPPDGEVFVLSQDPSAGGEPRFIIEDAPDAVKVKGMSFTVSPSTVEQEIAGWIALFSKDSAGVPQPIILWKWYQDRFHLQLTEKQCLMVAKFCLLSDVPVFFWIRGCAADFVETILQESIPLVSSRTRVDVIVGVAAFLGKTIFDKIVRKIQRLHKSALSKATRNYPSSGPRSLFSPLLVESLSRPKKSKHEKRFRDTLESTLQEIAQSVPGDNLDQPGVMKRRLSHSIDCYLYAQDDRYKKRAGGMRHP